MKLDDQILNSFELLGSTNSFDGCFKYFKLDKNQYSEESLALAKLYWEAGLEQGIQKAGNALFSRMQDKGGEKAAITYLNSNGMIKVVEDAPTGKGMSVNFIMPDGDKDAK